MPEKSDVARPRPGKRVPSGPRPLIARHSSHSLLSTINNPAAPPTSSHERWIPGDQGLTHSPPPASPAETAGLINPFDQSPPGASSSPTALSALASPTKGQKEVTKKTSTPILSIKPKSKPLKVNTKDLLPPPASTPKKAVSPSLQHWQQVRSHVLATPLEEKAPIQSKVKGGLVGKAAAKLGFRQGSEDAYGTLARADVKPAVVGANNAGGLSEAEKEEIARERRRFARDVKACLDACAHEESRRRLAGGKGKARENSRQASSGPNLTQSSSTFNPDFSAFAPLLTELHRYLPAARAKKAWCRTCPHHATILAELSTAFLQHGTSTTGERQQALEVFGVVVRSWAADGADEELSRWTWLCNALRVGDRQLRNRGLMLLSSFLHHDPALPSLGERPREGVAFQAVSVGLVQLLCAVEAAEYDAEEHRQTVLGLLADLVEGNIVEVDGSGGTGKELMWLALGRAVREADMAEWLFTPDNPILLRFAPPPLLHATPPHILQLRSQASITFLNSLALVIPTLLPSTILRVHRTMQDLIINPLFQLPGATAEMAVALGSFLVACLIFGNGPSGDHRDDDPFIQPSVDRTSLEALKQTFRSGELWAKGLEQALVRADKIVDVARILLLLELLLSDSGFKPLVSVGTSALIKRIDNSPEDAASSRDFLIRLSKSHPQIYYKPLFSLSASSLPSTTADHLRTVRTVSQTTGSDRFWLHADPRMVAIVLLGDGAPVRSKGKGREGEAEVVNVRIGRYAVLVEFLLALGEVKGGAKSGSKLRTYLDALELRLGAVLQVQEIEARLPEPYRALLCVLFYRLRMITRSARKADWQRITLGWFYDAAKSSSASTAPSGPLKELKDIHRSLRTSASTSHQPQSRKSTMMSDINLQPPPIPSTDPIYPLLHPHLLSSCTELLVLLHSCWTLDDWGGLLAIIWKRLGSGLTPPLPLLFLLHKCGEMVPAQLRTLTESDLKSTSPSTCSSSIHKLAMLYGYRYQISSLLTLSSRRGPLFHFPHETLDFVITEIGSPVWSAPHDVKEEALQKYGANVPMDVRQRLMKLGWSDDPGLNADEGNPAEPISSLPIRHLLEGGEGESRPGLTRQNSGSGSETSTGKKAQRAVFAPVLWEVVGNQAMQARGGDGGAASSSLELVRMLQRDEPNLFIRSFADHLSVDFRGALSRINAASIRSTPGFAYIAFNAVVGYLKQNLRHSLILDGYAYALTTLSSLVANVPEISLREIRKHKAEHVLLPASIHEEEGGFKVHAPWRDEQVDVQSAQLLLVSEILRVNPREVHIIKRMMSNLQLPRSALHDRTFARAWLGLIISLFALVNRNYNDRAELRHFLTTATVLLRTHQSDLPVVTLAVRLFMLCSARFRRLHAIMGFQTTMRSVFDTYASGNSATRDCIEYAMRSHYRIHQDSSVYQACLAITSAEADPGAVYSLLACLSEPNGPLAGISSGIRGLNDKEEHDALIQMLSGPEIALSEIGKDRAERQAEKLAQAASVESRLFSRESIVRLFVTVIAANPPSATAISMLGVFVGMVPHIKDEPSWKLLGEGVEALGGIISREKVDPAAAGVVLGDATMGGQEDWPGVKAAYVRLVDAWMAGGGEVSQATTKVVLEMMLGLLGQADDAVYTVGPSLLQALISAQLRSDKRAASLRVTAAAFQAALGVLDLSGVLDTLTAWVRHNDYEVGSDPAGVILESYLRPTIRHIVDTSNAGLAVDGRLQQSIVSLLAAAVLLPAGALDLLEEEPLSLGLLTHIVFPLVTSLEYPLGVELEKRASALWLRLLQLMIKPPSTSAVAETDVRKMALVRALSLQVIKVICVRAADTISSVKGLWGYIAHHLVATIAQSPARGSENVRLVDMMAWTTYQLLAQHRSPLMLHMRYHIQSALAVLEHTPIQAGPSPGGPSSSPYISDFGPSPHAGRIPSISLRRPSTNNSSSYPHHPNSPSSRHSARVSPSPDPPARSYFLTPRLSPSPSEASGSPSRPPRPTFTDLSLRRASRPLFDHPIGRPTGVGGTRFRFPSSADTRKTGGGAIVHLLGASSGVAAVTGGRISKDTEGGEMGLEEAVNRVEVVHPELKARVERAIKACRVVFGYPVDVGEDEEPIRAWSVHDALLEIAEETRLLVEIEFGDLFASTPSAKTTVQEGDSGGYKMEDLKGVHEDLAENEEDEEPLLPH